LIPCTSYHNDITRLLKKLPRHISGSILLSSCILQHTPAFLPILW